MLSLFRWATAKSIPAYDDIQSIFKTSMDVFEGSMEMSFSRQIFTSQQSQDFSLGNGCNYLLVAWGGTVSKYTSPALFGKHTTAQALPQLICLQDCKGKSLSFMRYKEISQSSIPKLSRTCTVAT